MIDTNVIYNEDCLIGMEKLGDKSVDLILTDLPYGVTAAKWDKYIDINKLWQHFERIITDKGVILMFGQEPFSSKLRLSNLDLYRYDIVWKKQKPSNFQLMNFQMGRVTENICVFSKAKACYTKNGIAMTYNPQLVTRDKSRKANVKIYGKSNLLHSYKTSDNYKTYEYRQPINILEFKTVTKNKTHPTQKPIPLLEYLIKTFSNENDVVLDCCMGTGATCIAAMNTNRKYIGFEIDENYYNIAKERIEENGIRRSN